MILSTLAPLLLLPLASASGVHKLQLKKLPPAERNHDLEALHLAEKYGMNGLQTPLMGAGGTGRQLKASRPSVNEDGEPLFWTQDMAKKGGHGVPLTSM